VASGYPTGCDANSRPCVEGHLSKLMSELEDYAHTQSAAAPNVTAQLLMEMR